MKWYGFWWGIVLLAEDAEERNLLKTLAQRLPPNAACSYDDGVAKYGEDVWHEHWDEPHECTAYLELQR